MNEVLEKIKALSKDKQGMIMAKLATIKDVDDVVALLKKEGIEVAKSVAKDLMDKFKGKVSIMDDLLANVSGGDRTQTIKC